MRAQKNAVTLRSRGLLPADLPRDSHGQSVRPLSRFCAHVSRFYAYVSRFCAHVSRFAKGWPVARPAASYALAAGAIGWTLACAACSGASSPGVLGSSGATSSGSGTSGGGSNGGGPDIVPTLAPIEGQATFYSADGTGACSFPATPRDLDVAALSASHYGNAAYCGACVKVKGPKAEITLRIVDLCPGCAKGSLDLSESAFAKIADPIEGVVPIRWSVVPCAAPGPLSYVTKEGTSKYWTAIQVRNHRTPIAKLEIEKGGVFVDAPRANYNYFVLATGAGTDGAFRVRVTSVSGETLIDSLPGPRDGATFPGSANFK
jgi:expansin